MGPSRPGNAGLAEGSQSPDLPGGSSGGVQERDDALIVSGSRSRDRSPWPSSAQNQWGSREFLIVGSLAAVATVAAVTVLLRLWEADIRIPLHQGGDTNFCAMVVKAIKEQGWYFRNPSLGAPFEQQMYDFPIGGDNLQLFAMRLIAYLPFSYGTILNLYYIATYPLVAISAAIVLRWLGTSRWTSVVISCLFALLPYHFARNQSHLFLSGYYGVPLGGFLAFRTLRGWTFRDGYLVNDRGRDRGERRKRIALTVALCAIVGSASSYYAAFSVVMVAAASVAAGTRFRSKACATTGAVVASTIIVVMAANVLPNVWYRTQNGVNEEVAHREAAESEVYSLKIAQILVPTSHHRVDALARLGQRYGEFPLQSEGGPSLGTAGALGMLFLLGVAVLGGVGAIAPRSSLTRFQPLAFIVIVSVLLSTTGGISSLIALLVTPQFRGWNRISVFIAFASLAAVGLALDGLLWRASRREGRSARRLPAPRRWIAPVTLALVLVLGALDQTSTNIIPNYSAAAAEYKSDADFIAELERSLPARAMVFQLPIRPFPEVPPLFGLADYDHLRGYLHSQTLRWSYGGMKGREGAWHDALEVEPLPRVLEVVVNAGFAGIYVDRNGYPDQGAAIEKELLALEQGRMIASPNGRLFFYQFE